jgi:hypothetical protein
MALLMLFSVQLVNSARSQIAADATALAGIYGGSEYATNIAKANLATPVSFTDNRHSNGTFTAVVAIGAAIASAQAFDQWAPALPTMNP